MLKPRYKLKIFISLDSFTMQDMNSSQELFFFQAYSS